MIMKKKWEKLSKANTKRKKRIGREKGREKNEGKEKYMGMVKRSLKASVVECRTQNERTRTRALQTKVLSNWLIKMAQSKRMQTHTHTHHSPFIQINIIIIMMVVIIIVKSFIF